MTIYSIKTTRRVLCAALTAGVMLLNTTALTAAPAKLWRVDFEFSGLSTGVMEGDEAEAAALDSVNFSGSAASWTPFIIDFGPVVAMDVLGSATMLTIESPSFGGSDGSPMGAQGSVDNRLDRDAMIASSGVLAKVSGLTIGKIYSVVLYDLDEESGFAGDLATDYMIENGALSFSAGVLDAGVDDAPLIFSFLADSTTMTVTGMTVASAVAVTLSGMQIAEVAVPEPSTYAMLGISLAVASAARRRRAIV